MGYKFEKLEVWQLSLELCDHIYDIANSLPDVEKFNLRSQVIRAVTSISFNIAEGSTSQSDLEQGRFLGYSIRSLIEVIACMRLMERRKYLNDELLKKEAEIICQKLFTKLLAFRNVLK